MTAGDGTAGETLGTLLSGARQQLRLSGRAAAKRAGLSESRWRQLEAGIYLVEGEPRPVTAPPDTVLRAADAVGLDPRRALLAAGFAPDEHLLDDELRAQLCRQALDELDRLDLDQLRALVGFLRTF